MPMVKLFSGFSAFRFSNTAAIWEGVVSLDDRPYLPPTTVTSARSLRALRTSRYRGSPEAPISLVRSSTATRRQDAGRDRAKRRVSKGR